MTSPTWFTWIVIALNILVLPYFLMVLVTATAALFSRRRSPRAASPTTRFLVVIPAHDEEEGIAATVKSCLALDYPRELFEIQVIADNCSDQTAAIAKTEGATVYERFDTSRKSKGYAISDLIALLKENGRYDRLDAIVIIDADTTVSDDLLRGLAAALESGEDWVQCFYTVANPDASWRTKLMAYAFTLFNGVTATGLATLGLSGGFRGNGMCFTKKGLGRVPWQSFGLVEDMEYSWNVRKAGGHIAFLPDVIVRGVMLARGGKAAASQRSRWESGRKEVTRRVFQPLLRSPHLSVVDKLTSLIELTMPSMVVLLAIYLIVTTLNLFVVFTSLWPVGTSIFLAASSVLMTLAIFIHAICPFLVFHLSPSYLLVLAYVPFYAVWKLFVALKGRPTQWVRTAREQPTNQSLN